jgi:hypothetical protein
MSRPNELLAYGRGFSRIWTEFIIAYQKDHTKLFCFFEGSDDQKYYNPRIKSIIFQNKDDNLRNLWCKGKQNVIKVFDLISKDARYEKAWVAFFIDRDFDNKQDLPNDDRVFVTPCYAIENLYVGLKTIKHILRDEFLISEDDDDFQSTVSHYMNMLDSFNDVIEELNAWLFLQRRIEKLTGHKTKVHINNLTDDELFTISINQITKNYTLEDLVNKFPEAPVIPQKEVSSQIIEFQRKGRTANFRGKYLISFQRRIVMCLAEDRGKRKKRVHFANRGRVQLQLSSNTLSELSQYAQTPESLHEFLTKRAEAYDKQLGLDL